MVDIIIPPALRQARIRFEYVDPSGYSASRYTGVGQSTNYGGDRVKATIDFTNHGGRLAAGLSERAQLKSFLMALQGSQGRIYVTDVSSQTRGTFSTSELLANNEFSSTSGWSANNVSLSASDGVLRATVAGTGTREAYQNATVVQYAAYALRVIDKDGRGTSGVQIGPYFDDGVSSAFAVSTTRGYHVASKVSLNAGSRKCAVAFFNQSTGFGQGDYVDVLSASMTRCLLVDGGGNGLLHSDAIGEAAWTKTGGAISTNLVTAPDGTSTGDTLVEDTSTGSHSITQGASRTSAVEDLCAYGFFRDESGTRNLEFIVDDGAGNGGRVNVNLTTGAISSTSNVGTGSFPRGFIFDAGNSWRFVAVIAQCPATTTVRFQAFLTSAGNVSYTGNGSAGMSFWRLGTHRTSVPTRGNQSTSAAVAASGQTASIIYVKGGRTPSEGSLESALAKGDWVEVDGQLLMVMSPLDLDASGRGTLQVSPPPRRSLADNTPIIIHKPMGRFMLSRGSMAGWSNDPGVFSSAQLELEAAFA